MVLGKSGTSTLNNDLGVATMNLLVDESVADASNITLASAAATNKATKSTKATKRKVVK